MAPGQKPRNLGFVFYDFSDSRAVEAIRGISSVLAKDKISYFPTGPLNKSEIVSKNNRGNILQAVKNSQIDGLISLQFFESEAWFKELSKEFFQVPVVPMLRSYHNAPGIISSYQKGAYVAVKHLLEVHGCRKPYYLLGSRSNAQNLKDRFAGYLQALVEFNIHYDESMKIVLQGDYSLDGIVSGALHYGGEAVDILFKQRKLTPGKDIDSLVVFNDRMAFEAMEALTQLGIKVPEQIHIISFDNTIESETAPIPLTTSAIDWFQLGVESCLMLKKRLSGELCEALKVPPELIIRKSCGCGSAIEYLMTQQQMAGECLVDEKIINKLRAEDETKNKLLDSSVNSMRHSAILRNAAMMFANCVDLEALSKACSTLFNYLKIEQCSLYLRNPVKKDGYLRQLHWTNQCHDYQYIEQPVNISELTQQIGKHKISVCESIDSGGEHLGFLLFGAADTDFVEFGEIKNLIRNSLQSLLLLEHLKQTQEQLQLIQQEKLTSVERLVAGVAHDVNTPLGIGVTAASALVEDSHKLMQKFNSGALGKQGFVDGLEGIIETSEIVQKNLTRASDLVRSFKGVSSKNSHDVLDNFLLHPVLQDVVVTMRPRIKTKKISINLQCDESTTIKSFPGALSQVLMNLITNSLKHAFTDRNEGRIDIKVEPTDTDEVRIAYSDDGIGMNAEVLARIYEPFFTTQAEHGGTGLGMFMVANLIEQKLQGQLAVDSTPEQGSRFVMVLPKTISAE